MFHTVYYCYFNFRKIRNTVIGNRKRKKLFLSNQAIQMYIYTFHSFYPFVQSTN